MKEFLEENYNIRVENIIKIEDIYLIKDKYMCYLYEEYNDKIDDFKKIKEELDFIGYKYLKVKLNNNNEEFSQFKNKNWILSEINNKISVLDEVIRVSEYNAIEYIEKKINKLEAKISNRTENINYKSIDNYILGNCINMLIMAENGYFNGVIKETVQHKSIKLEKVSIIDNRINNLKIDIRINDMIIQIEKKLRNQEISVEKIIEKLKIDKKTKGYTNLEMRILYMMLYIENQSLEEKEYQIYMTRKIDLLNKIKNVELL